MANNIIRRVWNQNRMVNIEDLTGAAFQAESGGHTFEISGIDDTGAAVSLSGTVAGVFRRPDNADIALTGSASDGVVSVTLSEDCYAVPGRFGLTIFVTSNSQKVAVYACVGTVAVSSTGNVAGDTPQDVVDLINAIEAAVATIPADYTDLMAAIAPAYSSSALYAVGSYAWYDGDLYRCTTPITTAETWTAAHWTAAVLGDDVSDLKSAIDKLDENTVQMMHYILQSIEPTTGKVYNTKTGTLESLGGNFVCVEFQVTYGDKLKISGWGISDNYKPRFWNESAIVATPSVGGDDNGYFYDVEVTVPNGATRLLINGRIGGIVISKYGTNSATEQYTSAVLSEARNNVVTFDEIIPQTFSLNSGQYVDTSTGVASSLYGFAYVDFPVTAGDILLLSGYGNTASNAPAFWSDSAIVKATGIVGDEENRFTDVRVVVPNGATRLLINGRPSFNINIAIKKVVNGDKSRQFFEEHDIAVEELSMARFNIKNLERRALNAEKANDFAWGTFDHPYFVFIHDDTNSFLPTAYSAFHAKGQPLGCATIVSKLENEYDNQTAKEWLDLVVADGGEVLTHWDYDLLSTSTDEEWYTHFVLPKRILEENGYDVRGAILANASHSYTAKGQSYCRKYYDYADKVGTTTQYKLGRTLMLNFADLPAFKSQLDIDLQSNGLYAYGFHGLRQDESWITEQNLKDIIDYIVDNGGIITTYASVFDAVGSTVLEQRISALE